MNNRWFKKVAKYLVVIFALILVPQSLNIQSELSMRTIISAVAVDIVDDKFLVTAQVVKPSSTAEGGGVELDFISASASTMAEAVDEVSVALGRTVGLAHIDTIVLGQEVLKQDKVMASIDYFLREKGIQSSAMLLVAEDKAKDALENTKKLQLSSAVGLPKVFLYKENNTNGVMMQLQTFLNDYFTVSNCSVISGFKIEGKEEFEKSEMGQSGQESSSGGSGGGGSSGSSSSSSSGGGSSGGGEKKDGRIKYANDIYIFKDGKHVHTITDDKTKKGLYLINRNSKEGVVGVDKITNEYVQDAKVSVYFRDKRVKIKTIWQNGLPKCVFTIITNRNEVFSIESTHPNQNLYETDKTYLTPDIEESVKEEIKKCVLSAFKECKEKGADVLQLGNRLYQRTPKQWKEFIEKYGKENYIQHIDLEVDVVFKKQI